MSITSKFAERADRIKPASIRSVVARIKPDCIPFAAGRPAEHLFPLEAVYQETGKMMEMYGGGTLQYASTIGYGPLREWIAGRVPTATPDNVLIVSGSQQAIDMVGKVFVDPGDKVIVSGPTFTSALNTLNVYGPEFVSIPVDVDGMDSEMLAEAMKDAKLVYVIPNFMNPTGGCMSLERRQELVALARQYEVPILEDDPYGPLRFEGEELPNLFELEPDWVIYAGTFSKIVAPGMRIGWLAGSAEVMPKLIIAKQTADLQTGTYQQMLMHGIVTSIDFEGHLAGIRDYYGRQCEVMLEAMDAHFPKQVAYERPMGGMFIWCVLPEGYNATEIFELALEKKVAYIPGESFFATGGGENTLRLSFSLTSEDQIREGIKALGDVFHSVFEN